MDDRSINSALFPIRLKEAMDDANENTHSLAERVSLSPSTISRYANGKMLPKTTTLYALASFLGVNPIWLMGYDKPKYTVLENVFDHPDIMPIETRKIPLLGDIACGEPIIANQEYGSYVEIGTEVKKAYDRFTDTIKKPKTEAGIRRVPLAKELRSDLEERIGEPFDYVFTQVTTGRRHTASSTNKLWQSFKKQVDISMGAVYEKRKAKDGKMRETLVLSVVDDDLTPYFLRHTFCTDMQRKGVPLKEASYIMGHSNISVTADIYTHVTDDMLDNVKAMINAKPNVNDVKRNVK